METQGFAIYQLKISKHVESLLNSRCGWTKRAKEDQRVHRAEAYAIGMLGIKNYQDLEFYYEKETFVIYRNKKTSWKSFILVFPDDEKDSSDLFLITEPFWK